MQEYTAEQIQERFEQLPPNLQEAISSVGVHDRIRTIGDRHGLKLDKIGGLVDQVGLVILGLAKSSSFVKDVSRKLSIDDQTARDMAEELNKEVFDAIRTSLRESETEGAAEPSKSAAISSVERAGGFKIEQEPTMNASDDKAKSMTETQKINMLSDIEEPTPIRKAVPRGEETLKTLRGEEEKIRSEPLVDRLLKNPMSIPEEKVERVPERPLAARPAPKAEPPRNLPTNDLYREPV